jgi:septum formation protein
MTAPRLILASHSAARRHMLAQAGLYFETVKADIDERALARAWGVMPPSELAARLAVAKAQDVSARHPDAFVIGSDQVLSLGDDIFSKAQDKNDAIKKLNRLRGRTHTLTSAVCLARGREIIWQTAQTAHLTMKNFSDDFLARYVESAGTVLTDCVGAYALEGTGIRLFEKIDGDYFTILGMPLLPLLMALEKERAIA